MSLCHFGQQLFVLLVGWVSWPIVGRRQDGKRVNGFGILPIFRNIRLASLDEFVILGFHVFVLLVELGVFVNCGPPGRVLGWVCLALPPSAARPHTSASKSKDFPGQSGDIWGALGTHFQPILGVPGAQAGLKNIYGLSF